MALSALGALADAAGPLVRDPLVADVIALAREPGEVRPTSDHSATGLNSATDLDGLRHTLNAYEEIAWFLELDYCMRMSDVEAAFPIPPAHLPPIREREEVCRRSEEGKQRTGKVHTCPL